MTLTTTLAAAAVLAAMITGGAAHAATWTFQNVDLAFEQDPKIPFSGPNETGTITGSFDYFAATNTYSNIDVTLELTEEFPGTSTTTFTYDASAPLAPAPSSTRVAFYSSSEFDNTGSAFALILSFVAPLEDTGGTIDLATWDRAVCSGTATSDCSVIVGLVGGNSAVNDGQVTAPISAVPLPASGLLFVGILGFGILGARQRGASPAA